MDEMIEVSIICNAYNQKKYIAQCLDGFLMQKTNFAFEILIHDDASTDGTADVIRTYEKEYPGLIKPIYQTENQYRKGGVSRFQTPRVKGRYVAFCEGDDYWTDPLKLQKQYDALEANQNIDICAHAASMLDGETDKKIRIIAPRNFDAVIPVEDVILGGGGFVATNSLFYRRELLNDPPPFQQMLTFDYTMQILGSLRGGMLYLNDCMSAYRFMTPGSWTVTQWNNEQKRTKIIDRINEMLDQLNMDTNGKYQDVIRAKQEFEILKNNCDYKRMISKEYRRCFTALSPMEQRHIYLKGCFPLFYWLWRQTTKVIKFLRTGERK